MITKIESEKLLTIYLEEYHVIEISKQVLHGLPDVNGIYATIGYVSYLIHNDTNCSVKLELVNGDSCIVVFSDGTKKQLRVVLVPKLEIE